jgi:hypothetical protein
MVGVKYANELRTIVLESFSVISTLTIDSED